MIVKGHDFPKVTLVGIIAADLSLYTGDFRASERTFQLLCQAAGRAGRDALPGEVVIQTYHPEHYSITTAADGDYEAFFEQEMLYRRLMQYPPAAHILLILITSKEEKLAEQSANHLGEAVSLYLEQQGIGAQMIGPAPAAIAKAKDVYRRVIYIKQGEYVALIKLKNYLEGYFEYSEHFAGCNLQFDFDPMNGY
jgi:primosomal protein N' (replication factor Y)